MEKNLNNSAMAACINNAENVPFVNEECGDTMWDEVLKDNDKRKCTVKADELLQLVQAIEKR